MFKIIDDCQLQPARSAPEVAKTYALLPPSSKSVDARAPSRIVPFTTRTACKDQQGAGFSEIGTRRGWRARPSAIGSETQPLGVAKAESP
jgi:hypothetical protein